MRGLTHALSYAKGKRVLDLGCAEAAIAVEFALAGAAHVHGMELLPAHLTAASAYVKCSGAEGLVTLQQTNLRSYSVESHPHFDQYDMVLALSVIHKMEVPATLLRFAARVAKEWLVYRPPGRSALVGRNGVIRSKHRNSWCDAPTLLRAEGFECTERAPSAREEVVEYWRRT